MFFASVAFLVGKGGGNKIKYRYCKFCFKSVIFLLLPHIKVQKKRIKNKIIYRPIHIIVNSVLQGFFFYSSLVTGRKKKGEEKKKLNLILHILYLYSSLTFICE